MPKAIAKHAAKKTGVDTGSECGRAARSGNATIAKNALAAWPGRGRGTDEGATRADSRLQSACCTRCRRTLWFCRWGNDVRRASQAAPTLYQHSTLPHTAGGHRHTPGAAAKVENVLGDALLLEGLCFSKVVLGLRGRAALAHARGHGRLHSRRRLGERRGGDGWRGGARLLRCGGGGGGAGPGAAGLVVVVEPAQVEAALCLRSHLLVLLHAAVWSAKKGLVRQERGAEGQRRRAGRGGDGRVRLGRRAACQRPGVVELAHQRRARSSVRPAGRERHAPRKDFQLHLLAWRPKSSGW